MRFGDIIILSEYPRKTLGRLNYLIWEGMDHEELRLLNAFQEEEPQQWKAKAAKSLANVHYNLGKF